MVVFVQSSQDEFGVKPGNVYASLEAAKAALEPHHGELIDHGEQHWASADGTIFLDEHEVLGLEG